MKTRSIAIWTCIAAVACAVGLWVASLSAPGPLAPGPAFRLAVWALAGTARNFLLVDGSGRTRSLGEFRGRVVLLFFGFTHCPDVCPTELFRLAKLMDSLGPDGAKMQVLFVTLDPERDTPAVMRDYVSAFHPAFVGLTGTAEQIDSAANSFNVARTKIVSGDDYVIDHSTVTYVIDRAGRLRLIGRMDTPIEDLAHDLRLLFEE